MSRRVTVLTPAEVLPISVSEVREALRIEHTEDDVHIARLITGAVAAFERETGVCVMQQALRFVGPIGMTAGYGRLHRPFPAPAATLALPRRPVVSVESYSYEAYSNGAYLEAESLTGFTLAGAEIFYPYALSGRFTVDFTAGYSSDPEELPPDLRMGLLRAVCDLYTSPESYVVGQAAVRLPVVDLLSSYYSPVF